MSSLSKPFALVTRYIRSLRGGSQPVLAEASDGNVYVVKFTDNLQGPHLPFNECMGTELYRACGLPVAPWKTLQVTDSFLDQTPACWFETPEGRQRPAPGLCFASRFLGGGGTRLFEILPGSYFQRVTNAADFWLAQVLDVCARHSDSRQAIFCEGLSERLYAVFIDFGHMFAGATGSDENPHTQASWYRDERIYPHVSPRFLLTLRRILDSVDVDQLWRLLDLVPAEWRTMSATQHFNECIDRLSDGKFLNTTFETMVKSHQLIEREELLPGCERKPALSILHPGILSDTRGRRVVAL